MIDPRATLFAAVPKRANRFDDEDCGCSGCLFERERSTVCRVVEQEAKQRRLPDCEDGFVYIMVKVDPRQRDLVEECT